MGVLRKVETGSKSGPSSGRQAEDKFIEGLFPTLWEYLSADAWPDGSERETSTVTMFVEQGMVKVCLSDRANDRSAWSSGETLEEAVLSLEGALAADRTDWRKRPSSARGSRPK